MKLMQLNQYLDSDSLLPSGWFPPALFFVTVGVVLDNAGGFVADVFRLEVLWGEGLEFHKNRAPVTLSQGAVVSSGTIWLSQQQPRAGIKNSI